jgi:hypothetical protein
MALSTVSAVLLREGLGKRSRLEPPEPINRNERSTPGELVHVDIKSSDALKAGQANAAPAVAPTRARRSMPTASDASASAMNNT